MTAVLHEDELEDVLEASGFPWSRRESGWAVPAGENLPRELRIERVPGGARVEAVLAEWDRPDEPCPAALAAFFAKARGPGPARLTLDGRAARVEAAVDGERLEAELPAALAAVAAACRRLAREVRALLNPDAARAYQAFHEINPAGPAGGTTAG